MKIYLVVESDISFTFDSQHEPAPDERVIKSYFVRRIGPRGSATDTNKVGIFYRYRVKIFFITQIFSTARSCQDFVGAFV